MAQKKETPTGLIEFVDLNKVDWKKLEHEFYKYRNSFDGVPVITISSLFFFLEHNKLSPFATREAIYEKFSKEK